MAPVDFCSSHQRRALWKLHAPLHRLWARGPLATAPHCHPEDKSREEGSPEPARAPHPCRQSDSSALPWALR